jgi:hypothetical protein
VTAEDGMTRDEVLQLVAGRQRFEVTVDDTDKNEAQWWRRYRNTLTIKVDGVEVQQEEDGGEPEDNLFSRDYKWVPQALRDAYALGYAHALEVCGPSRFDDDAEED